jgi:hypothetical protein
MRFLYAVEFEGFTHTVYVSAKDEASALDAVRESAPDMLAIPRPKTIRVVTPKEMYDVLTSQHEVFTINSSWWESE